MMVHYDEQRNVWVFPVVNPDELAEPIGAPPTIPAAGPSTPGPTVANESKPTPDDPLAAMMAPPKRAPSSFKRPGATGGNYTPQGMASPLAATPPQVAVFNPKPSTKEEQKSD
jgi:hypothetical protein